MYTVIRFSSLLCTRIYVRLYINATNIACPRNKRRRYLWLTAPLRNWWETAGEDWEVSNGRFHPVRKNRKVEEKESELNERCTPPREPAGCRHFCEIVTEMRFMCALKFTATSISRPVSLPIQFLTGQYGMTREKKSVPWDIFQPEVTASARPKTKESHQNVRLNHIALRIGWY
jgi:hypothetical protein